MPTQEQIKQALEVIPEANSLISIVQQAAKEIRLDPAHLVRVAATAIRLNPKLAKCTSASFVGALIALEQVGLEPVAGRAYLIPFLNSRKIIINGREEWRKQYEVQALIGYKGYADLFYRHESALTIESRTVHQGDIFDYEYGSNSFLRHKPAMGERGPAIMYYTIAKMKDGAMSFLVMSKQECLAHGKKHSKTYDKKTNGFMPGTPWVDDEDAMCQKTTLLQMKNLPLSIKIQEAMSVDETSREYRPGIESALDLPNTTNWDDNEPADIVVDAKQPTGTTNTPKKLDIGLVNAESTSKEPEINPALIASIQKIQKKVGDKIFYAVLGGMGYEKIEQIRSTAEINKLISEIDRAYADSADSQKI